MISGYYSPEVRPCKIQLAPPPLGSDVTLHLEGALIVVWCRTSTLIMVPVNIWQNSVPFEKKRKNIFLAQKLTELELF